MKKRKVLGILMIIIGIGIFCYPMMRQAYTQKRQKELKAAFEQILKENLTNATVAPTIGPTINEKPSPADTFTPTTDIAKEPTGTSAVELHETEEEVADTQTKQNVRDRLHGQTVLGLIEIKKIDLLYAIVEGTSVDNLGVAIGHMSDTADLGEDGNCALAGHRGGVSGPYFKNIDKLVKGDSIVITNREGEEYTYKVTESFTVEPTDIWVADEVSNQKMLTLITCKNSGTKRLIVRAVCE